MVNDPDQVPLAASSRIQDRLPPGFGDALALFLTMRFALGLVVIYLWWRGGLPGPCHFELARNDWQTIPPLADQGAAFPLVGTWQRWDACWYSKIATFGYEPAELSVNFWPLFPVLSGGVARVVGGSVALAGMIVSAIAYIAAMVGLFRLVARDIDEVVARRTMLLITIFPSAFFLFAPFTESLFLALSVWTIVAARERSWLLAAVLGGLAALTRIQGVFLALPIGWEALMASGLLHWRPSAGPDRSADRVAAAGRRRPCLVRTGDRVRQLHRLHRGRSPVRPRSIRRTRGVARSSSRHGRWSPRRGAGRSSVPTRSRV